MQKLIALVLLVATLALSACASRDVESVVLQHHRQLIEIEQRQKAEALQDRRRRLAAAIDAAMKTVEAAKPEEAPTKQDIASSDPAPSPELVKMKQELLALEAQMRELEFERMRAIELAAEAAAAEKEYRTFGRDGVAHAGYGYSARIRYGSGYSSRYRYDDDDCDDHRHRKARRPAKKAKSKRKANPPRRKNSGRRKPKRRTATRL